MMLFHLRQAPGRRPRGRAVVPSRAEAFEPRVLCSVFTVTTTADGGPGSLRQAVLDANAASGADEIHFDIAGRGMHVIAPLSTLPEVRESVTIEGTTQPG